MFRPNSFLLKYNWGTAFESANGVLIFSSPAVLRMQNYSSIASEHKHLKYSTDSRAAIGCQGAEDVANHSQLHRCPRATGRLSSPALSV